MTSRIVAGTAWALVVAAALAAGAVHASDQEPKSEPPEPPAPPPGIAEVYYATCGGAHVPVKVVATKVGPGDPGYEEMRKYYASEAYRKYLREVQQYIDESESKPEPESKPGIETEDTSKGDGGTPTAQPPEEKSPRPKAPKATSRKNRPAPHAPATETPKLATPPAGTPAVETPPVETPPIEMPPMASDPEAPAAPESTAAPSPRGTLDPNFRPAIKLPGTLMGYDLTQDPFWNGSKLSRGASAHYVNRDPKQDLARWLRSSLYHDPVDLPEYANHSEETPVKLTEIDSK